MTRRSDRPGGRRSAARLGAVQALYQIDLAHAPVERTIVEFVADRLGKEVEGSVYQPADLQWFEDVVRGASERQDELDRLIGGMLSDRPLERMETLVRAMLRAGAYELIARVDTPAQVIIAEYVDVAYAFFSGAEPGLVNGILDRLARQIRTGEFGGSTDRARRGG